MLPPGFLSEGQLLIYIYIILKVQTSHGINIIWTVQLAHSPPPQNNSLPPLPQCRTHSYLGGGAAGIPSDSMTWTAASYPCFWAAARTLAKTVSQSATGSFRTTNTLVRSWVRFRGREAPRKSCLALSYSSLHSLVEVCRYSCTSRSPAS